MKKNVFTFVISLLAFVSMQAQKEQQQYLFHEFRDGIVYFKEGSPIKTQLNYSLVSNCFVFIDTYDEDKIKQFGDVNIITCVKVDDRTFLQQWDGSAYEILQQAPFFAVKYKGRIRSEGKSLGYGARSELAAVNSYSAIMGESGRVASLKTEKFILLGVDNLYLVEIRGKKKIFGTEKKFLKIYAEYKNKLKSYIEEYYINFNNAEQVHELVNYANSIENN